MPTRIRLTYIFLLENLLHSSINRCSSPYFKTFRTLKGDGHAVRYSAQIRPADLEDCVLASKNQSEKQKARRECLMEKYVRALRAGICFYFCNKEQN